MLFKVEAAVRLGYTKKACTDELCKWNQDFVKKVNPDPIAKIKFFSEKKIKIAKSRPIKRKNLFEKASEEDQHNFLSSLKKMKTSSKPVVLSCFDGFSDDFHWTRKPEPDPKLPPPLTSLYKEENIKLNPTDLKEQCDVAFSRLKLSDDDIQFVNKSTEGQSENLIWHEQRTGRITSSTVHSVIRTDPKNPSKSAINEICNPRKKRLQTEPIKWGNEHEQSALKAYKQIITTSNIPHTNMQMKKEGLQLCKEKPFLGVSADSIVSCDCHGLKLVEVKCPFSAKEMDIKSFLAKPDCFIQENKLKKMHKYYSQVQLQMYVYGANVCDFVVWAPKFMLITYVHRDEEFIKSMIDKCESMYKSCILPELLTRRLAHDKPHVNETQSNKLYCICQQPEDEKKYVGCDNPKCSVQWFHLQCLKLKREPKGFWLCPDCRKL